MKSSSRSSHFAFGALMVAGASSLITSCSTVQESFRQASSSLVKGQNATSSRQSQTPGALQGEKLQAPMFTPEPPKSASSDPPPEVFDPKPEHAVKIPLFVPTVADEKAARRILKASEGGKALKVERTTLKGIPLYKFVINMDDPQTLIDVGLPANASEANSATVTHGDESFAAFNQRYKSALLANGTFFSKDKQKRIMGNLVTCARFRKYSQFEDYGTTFGIRENNQMDMVTARLEGKPNWSDYWFSLTCGPRLLRDGQPAIDPASEGFRDSHVLTIGPRAAIGFNRKKRQIIYCAFLRGLSLEKEAELMKAVGCDEAMNLDGGASRALAIDGKVLIEAGRPLTNVLIVYDAKHPAPRAVIKSWNDFQDGARATLPR